MGWAIIPLAFVGATVLSPAGDDSGYYEYPTHMYGYENYSYMAPAPAYGGYAPSYIGGTCPGCPPMGYGGPATYNPVGYGTPASPY